MLVPNDSVDWNIKISAESFSNFKTGPFAFFEAITKARQLEQGEYFSFPDSILYPGENFVRTRPKDNMGIYKYHLRQEQFVWLGNYKKGDSVIVYHSIENYTDNDFESPVTYEILDKDQKVRGSISSVNGGAFSVKGDMPEGPYYLHYLRLKSNPKDQVFDSLRYVLQLTTLVQQPGLLKTMKFYDDEKMASYNTKTLAVGDSIYFDKFTFQMTQIEDTDWDIIGSDISWLVPCASLNYINLGTNPYKESSCEDNDNKEQEIASNHLIVLDAIGETALLIAQSTADPAKRDTLKILIIAKSN